MTIPVGRSPRRDVSGVLGPAQARNVAVAVVVPPHPTFTRPYFSRPSVEQSYYNIDDPRYLNLPTSYYPLSAKLTFHYHGVDFHTTAVVQSVHRVTGPGPMLEPLLVGPPISLWLSPAAGIVPLSSATLHLQVTLHSDVEGAGQGRHPPRASPGLDLESGFRRLLHGAGRRRAKCQL